MNDMWFWSLGVAFLVIFGWLGRCGLHLFLGIWGNRQAMKAFSVYYKVVSSFAILVGMYGSFVIVYATVWQMHTRFVSG